MHQNDTFDIDYQIGIELLLPGHWLTDTIIYRQMSSLAEVDQTTAYLATSFFTRFYDMEKSNTHYTQCSKKYTDQNSDTTKTS